MNNISENLQHIENVLRLCIKYDITDELFWCIDKETNKIKVMVNCNDVFWWATSDGEEITPDNLCELKKAIDDVNSIDNVIGIVYTGMLFAARIRKIRPQGAAYPEEKKFWPLFDMCGKERPIDKDAFGNPYKPGEYK